MFSIDTYLTGLRAVSVSAQLFQEIVERHAEDPRVQRYFELGAMLEEREDEESSQAFYTFVYTATVPELGLPWATASTCAFRLGFERATLPHLAEFCAHAECILEAGCGEGMALGFVALAHPHARIVGVDRIPCALDLVRTHVAHLGCKNVTCMVGDLFAERPRERFDRILCRNVFGGCKSVRSRDSVPKLAQQFRILRKLLADDGRIWYSTTPSPQNRRYRVEYVTKAATHAELAIDEARTIPFSNWFGEQEQHLAFLLRHA